MISFLGSQVISLKIYFEVEEIWESFYNDLFNDYVLYETQFLHREWQIVQEEGDLKEQDMKTSILGKMLSI